tara:strand:+ start:714 stop:908 length:195 start_codon:yes stop_codon:yes gene_type:complete
MLASIFAWFVMVSIFTILYVIGSAYVPNDLLWGPLLSPTADRVASWFVIVAYITYQSIYSNETK